MRRRASGIIDRDDRVTDVAQPQCHVRAHSPDAHESDRRFPSLVHYRKLLTENSSPVAAFPCRCWQEGLGTPATLDGHPIALGVPGGYNYQLSPIAGLRNIAVTYGSGSNLLGTSAIGGVVDFQTLDPTPERRLSFAQGYGTFDKAATMLQASGTVQRLGYVLAYGVARLDGPLKKDHFYQPGAAYDQSAPLGSAVHALGVYEDDSTAVSRSGLLKLRYDLGTSRALTFTGVASSYWNDKTANGDGDYTDYAPARAFGKLLLRSYDPANFPSLSPCPQGTFVATNANGAPGGFGPSGKPDGGITCQTPRQYAAFNTGFDGAGPAWQSFNFDDYHLGYEATALNQSRRIDVFTNRYFNTIDRHFALPFVTSPGDSPESFTINQNVGETGAAVSDTLLGRNNDVGLGYTYLTTAYELASSSPGGTSRGAPIVRESGLLLRDVYHPQHAALTSYLDVNLKHATATHSSYVDPRVSLVYAASPRDVLRVAAGATTTQPSGDELDQPFVPQPPGGAGGGPAIDCTGLNAIGSAPSSLLRPERGVDEEFAYGHRFFGDTQAQLTLYNVGVFDKLYQTIEPLGPTSTSFIDPRYLGQVTQTVAAKCGTLAPALLGLTGTFNVGELRARGFTLSGRQRLDRRDVHRLRLDARLDDPRLRADAAAAGKPDADRRRTVAPPPIAHAVGFRRPPLRPHRCALHATYGLGEQHENDAGVRLQRVARQRTGRPRNVLNRGQQPLRPERRHPRPPLRGCAPTAQWVRHRRVLRTVHRRRRDRTLRSPVPHDLFQLHAANGLAGSSPPKVV